jgi:hypothetical protein
MVFVATMLVNATAANGVRWAFRSGSDLPLADRLAQRGDITHLPGAEDASALGAIYQTLFPPYLPTPGTTSSSAAATAPN